MKKIITLCLFYTTAFFAQDVVPTTELNLYLKCIEGGVFANKEVVFTNTNDGSVVKAKSDVSGVIKIKLPCGNTFEYKVQNLSEKQSITIPSKPLRMMGSTLNYSKNDVALAEKYKMSVQQMQALETIVKTLPDTMYPNKDYHLKQDQNFVSLSIKLKDTHKKNLINESVIVSARKYKKTFKGITDNNGQAVFILPKGDVYDISFKYDKNFDTKEINTIMGLEDGTIEISYIGSKEIERLKKENEIRLKAEAMRLEKEKKEFEAYRKKAGLSLFEARKKEIKEYETGKRKFTDDVVLKVFNRNKHWKDKLIVCDLTGSMSPYAAQLEVWYKLNYLKEQNIQFTFFNDGDNMSDELKKIGSTGGIYYSKDKGLDSLIYLMAKVQTYGYGGDCPENNIEALMLATKKATHYNELIMIADNNAPIKDIALLENFNATVRIILCGVNNQITDDYLKLAWKTKGSIHTMEEDLLSIGKLLDGQEIIINKQTYKLMKNRFILITKT